MPTATQPSLENRASYQRKRRQDKYHPSVCSGGEVASYHLNPRVI